MSFDLKTKFSINSPKVITSGQQDTTEKISTPEPSLQYKNHTVRDISIGAVGAATVLISLGVLARKGKLGQKAQRFISGANPEGKPSTFHPELSSPKAPEPSIVNPQANPKTMQQTVNTKPSKPQAKSQPKPSASVETYSTKLPETIKKYTANDIDICGQLGKLNFRTSTNRKANPDILQKVQGRDITTIYNEAEKSTNIIVPLGNDFYSIKINGIVAVEKARSIIRTINANGISDVNQFPEIVLNVLNGKMNTPYSIKNIGMYYDFHDQGAYEYKGGGGKWATDGRILLRDALQKWEGYAISYNKPQKSRTTTQIAVALPTNPGERACSNHYAIFLDGLIPPGLCARLIKHLETNVIKNPKDVLKSELPKIQAETIAFLNRN